MKLFKQYKQTKIVNSKAQRVETLEERKELSANDEAQSPLRDIKNAKVQYIKGVKIETSMSGCQGEETTFENKVHKQSLKLRCEIKIIFN